MAVIVQNIKQLSGSTIYSDLSVCSDVAWESRGTAIDPRVWHIFSRRFGHKNISTAILPLPLIREEHLSINAKRCALSTGNLLRGGLPRNSVDRITDRSDMTSAVYRGSKASTQTNKQTKLCFALLVRRLNKYRMFLLI